MAMPELESANVKELNLRWVALKGKGLKYELFGDNDGDTTFTSIIKTDATTYKVKKDLGDLSYNFKVRASNICGNGPDSLINRVNLVLAPARVAKPSRIIKDCTLIVEWAKPDPHGTPILDYSVEVRGSGSPNFFKVPMCGK